VVLLKADWTKRDARITEALAGFGRASVPLYVVYGGASRAPVVLETNPLLSPASVIEAFRAAGDAKTRASPSR
jgi:thiol:disulfide interchange protein DsbD